VGQSTPRSHDGSVHAPSAQKFVLAMQLVSHAPQ
jgi:hypothetical protein